MHLDNAEMLGAFICAIAIVRFWRLILMFILLVITCAIVLGCVAAATYIHH